MEGKLSYWVRSILTGECEASLLRFWQESCLAHIHPADWYAMKDAFEKEQSLTGTRRFDFSVQSFCGIGVWQDVNVQRGTVRMKLDEWRYERHQISFQYLRGVISLEEMFTQLEAVNTKFRVED